MKLNMLLLVGLFFWTNAVLGEGSKDLYPKSVKGNRAFLVSQPYDRSAFSNQASHYTYAQEGETIAVASSAQNVGFGRIILTAPDGTVYQTKADNIGQIAAFNGSTRGAELAGPGIGYVPYEVKVAEGQAGIWHVEFTSPDTDPFSASLIEPYNLRADGDWVQHTEGCLIAAWDISVKDVKNTAWLPGRVFMTVLQLHLSRESLAESNGAFYGRNYVLTKDGYIYHVDANGSHGIDFAYFVNSSGLLDKDGKPTYKSANQGIAVKYHNPNHKDDNLHITHKMFYNFPDNKMPEESRGYFPGDKSWLLSKVADAKVTGIGVNWEDGKVGILPKNGVAIHFNANRAGRYRIVIGSKSDQYYFKPREFSVDGEQGENVFFWDGLDGGGNPLPKGKDYKIGILVSLVKGEIHFPYFDMEINPNGILVDRMNMEGNKVEDAVMYWDDTDITDGQPSESSKTKVNKTGIPSRIDGHSWGTYKPTKYINNGASNGGYGAYSYGNECAMDTWTYTAQLQAEIDVRLSVGVADDNKEEPDLPVLKEKHIQLYQGGEVVFDLLEGLDGFLNDFVKINMLDVPLCGDFLTNKGIGVYRANEGPFFGNDVFSYQLVDGNGVVSGVCKVHIKILKTKPIAKDDFFDVVYSSIDISEIVSNDYVVHSYLDKESLRVVDRPQNGILIMDGDGKWLYQSNDGFMGKDQFSYQIMDANGNWSNIASVNIQVRGLFIPNTITPNNDMKNDTFQIVGLSNFDQAEVSIIDRFGRLVFASMDYKNDWIAPSNLASGVYFYVFRGSKLGQSTVVSKGTLMVLTTIDVSK